MVARALRARGAVMLATAVDGAITHEPVARSATATTEQALVPSVPWSLQQNKKGEGKNPFAFFANEKTQACTGAAVRRRCIT